MAVFPFIKAHVLHGFPLPTDRRSSQTGTGSTRNQAIRARIRPNIRPDTATSAIWKVMQRPWRTILAPILTSFSLSVVRDQCAIACGRASVRRKLARL